MNRERTYYFDEPASATCFDHPVFHVHRDSNPDATTHGRVDDAESVGTWS